LFSFAPALAMSGFDSSISYFHYFVNDELLIPIPYLSWDNIEQGYTEV